MVSASIAAAAAEPSASSLGALERRVERVTGVDLGSSFQLAELGRLRALHEQFATATRALSALIEGMTGDPWAHATQGPTATPTGLVAPAPRVEVRLLGPFEVTVDGKPVGLRAGGKPVAVLKFMAATGDQPIPRDVILEALWPDVPVDAAGSRLRTAMHALRRMFAGNAAEPAEILEYEHGQYRLFPGAALVTDVERFEAAFERGRRHDHNGEFDGAIAAYTEADRLYRGDFLEDDLYTEWPSLRREQLRDAHLTLLTRLANLHLDQGDEVSAISLSHKVVSRDECSDEAYRILITAHGRRGERTAAKRWFEIGERALNSGLKVRPSAATRDALQHAAGAGYAGPHEAAPAEAPAEMSGRARTWAQIEAGRRG